MTTVFLATVGPVGLREIARQNVIKTAYAVKQISEKTPHEVLFTGPRFNEFVVRIEGDFATTVQRARESGVVPGVDLGRFYPELAGSLLACVTEVHTKEDIDSLVGGLA
jgi:glycine dehydrogenase subunit 1